MMLGGWEDQDVLHFEVEQLQLAALRRQRPSVAPRPAAILGYVDMRSLPQKQAVVPAARDLQQALLATVRPGGSPLARPTSIALKLLLGQ